MRLKQKHRSQAGFTIIELLIVLAIMGMFLSLLLINYASGRGKRNLRIAQNELATNVRKVQSYALASKNTSVGPVKYYVMRFSTTNPTQYLIEAAQQDLDTYTTPVEIINLPKDIVISAIETQQPYGTATVSNSCAQLAFALPFNKLYVDTTCSISSDDESVIRDQGALAYLDDSLVTLTLLDPQSNTTRSVIINGASGVVTVP